MTTQELLSELKTAINCEADLTPEMILKDIPQWDSLAIICVITLFEEKLQKHTSFEQLQDVKSVQDLISLAGLN
ncbi:MAG: acyl carrier protein [Alphaproteobacteria bacterium]|nr:acyl carrier protein [Alphaproteobacteria bacterium]